jgi:hypothetical protein
MDGDDRFAADGVSCAVCHQIGPERLGTRESFNGGFVLVPPTPEGQRRMFGPYEVDPGRQTIMRSASGMTPAQATHLRESEVCATCHTLYTRALGSKGEVLGELPEQVPFLEWQHSAFRQEQSCQACHMPEIAEPTRIASVLGEERPGVRRHTFLGGNFFMLRMLNRYRDELGVEALPRELEAAASATIAQLQQQSASVAIAHAEGDAGPLAFDVTVRNARRHCRRAGVSTQRTRNSGRRRRPRRPRPAAAPRFHLPRKRVRTGNYRRAIRCRRLFVHLCRLEHTVLPRYVVL